MRVVLKLLRQLALTVVLMGTLFVATPTPASAAPAVVAAELVQPVQFYRPYGYGYGPRYRYYHRPYYYRRPFYPRPFFRRRFYGRPYYYRRY